MLRILLLIVPIFAGWPVLKTDYDGVHCYNGSYTILLNGTFWCHGSPETPSKLDLWQYEGVKQGEIVDNNIGVNGSRNNELHYNKTFNYKDTYSSLSVSLHVLHSCDMFYRDRCSHLYVLKIPDSYIYCNGSMNPYYNFSVELSSYNAQSANGCPDDMALSMI